MDNNFKFDVIIIGSKVVGLAISGYVELIIV